MKYCELFSRKPVIAMLHLMSGNGMDMLTRAKREIKCFYENGVDAVLVENYFGSTEDCKTVLAYLQNEYHQKIYGVNILGDYNMAFSLADEYGAKFIQIDSVCGHLTKEKDAAYGEALKQLHERSQALVFGGVRFKYQPVCSGRTLEEDLEIGSERCDAIVVTGEGTGEPTPNEKLCAFNDCFQDRFPIITGAGVTLETVEDALTNSDGIIIGSWLKDGHDAHGEVCEEYVKAFMEKALPLQKHKNALKSS